MLTVDELLGMLWRRKLTFVATFVLVLLAVAVGTFTQPKVYSATAYVLVASTGTAGSDFEATQTNQVVLKTYAELLQTRSVSTEVVKALPFRDTPDGVERSVTVAPITQSQLISITAEAGDPGRAQTLANTYGEVFVQRAALVSASTGGTIRATLADRAARDDRPIRPRPKLYLAVGAVLASLLAAGVALVKDRTDQHLKIGPDTTELLGIPILARLPEQSHSSLSDLARFADGSRTQTLLNEAFDLLLTNIMFARLGASGSETIAVVSSGPGEGKSTTCVGLARAAASHDLPVLLVDGDLRRGQLTEMLGLDNDDPGGFAQVLAAGGRHWQVDRVGTEVLPDVRAVPAGRQVSQPTALLSASIPAFARWAGTTYSVVVFDTPPVSVGADASLIAAAADEVLLVVNVRSVSRSGLLQTVGQLRRVNANVIGIVLNRTDASEGPKGYYGDRAAAAVEAGAPSGGDRT